jgi:hypothetical protein
MTRYRYLDTVAQAVRRAEPAARVAIETAGLYVLVTLLWAVVVFTAVTASFP